MIPAIDIVYTFVDPTDTKWISKYSQYNNNLDKIRFDGNDSLIKFSLLTIEKYMPWVNKIYIVNDQQKFEVKSKFLQQKIIWIDHTQIIPKKFLPTFNSLTIESFLYKIPNLSKYFLYFNDDMFLGADISISDLFDEQSKKPIQFFTKCIYYDHPWMDSIRNANSLFKHVIDFQHSDLCPQHAPYFIDKDIIEIVFNKFYEFLKKMYTIDKVRSYGDYSYNLIFLYAMYMTTQNLIINKKTSFSAISKFTQDTLNLMSNATSRKKFYCFFVPIDTAEKTTIYHEIKKIILMDNYK